MLLLSWNIQWGCGCDGRVDFARIAAVLREMGGGGADAICLQEVAINHGGLAGSTGENQAALIEALFPGYSAHYAIGSDLAGVDGQRRCFGNLLLSRLPVLQVLRHSLPQGAEAGRPSMPRVALEAVLATGHGNLRLTTSHLEYYAPRQRTAQLRRLRSLHEEACGHALNPVSPRDLADLDPPFQLPPRPLSAVVCGDFNCEPTAEGLQHLAQPFSDGIPALVDAWQIAHPGQAHAHTVGLHGCPWPERPYCCDYFFVSEDLRTRVRRMEVNQATAASDHQPILLELELSAN